METNNLNQREFTCSYCGMKMKREGKFKKHTRECYEKLRRRYVK